MPDDRPVDITPQELTEQLGILWRTMRNGSSVESFRQWLYSDDHDTIEPSALRFLQTLAEVGEARLSTVASKLAVNPSTVSRTVVKLEADGLVERRPDPNDHRSSFISLTAAGEARVDRYLVRAQEALSDILSVFTYQEQVDLASQLTRFVESLEKFMEPDPADPS